MSDSLLLGCNNSLPQFYLSRSSATPAVPPTYIFPPDIVAGVAYVKFDKASSAALAIENLHEVTLNDGLGPRLKVMLADSPHSRYVHVFVIDERLLYTGQIYEGQLTFDCETF